MSLPHRGQGCQPTGPTSGRYPQRRHRKPKEISRLSRSTAPEPSSLSAASTRFPSVAVLHVSGLARIASLGSKGEKPLLGRARRAVKKWVISKRSSHPMSEVSPERSLRTAATPRVAAAAPLALLATGLSCRSDDGNPHGCVCSRRSQSWADQAFSGSIARIVRQVSCALAAGGPAVGMPRSNKGISIQNAASASS